MGEASDDPDISNRECSWAKKANPGNTDAGLPLHDRHPSTLNNIDKSERHDGQQTGPTTIGSNEEKQHGGHSSAHLGTAYLETLRGSDDNTPVVHATPAESKEEGTHDPTIDPVHKKGPLKSRMKAGSIRFVKHTKKALTHSWINVLLIFVPIGIIMRVTNQSPTTIFAVNAVAIIPLAALLVYATESVALRVGDTLGALLNVSFGNAVELIIYIIALSEGQIRIVQASLLGSLLSNLLLIMGMAFLLGGLRFREQVYNNTVTQMSSCLLSLSVSSLLLPTAFHASFSDTVIADFNTLRISRATSVVLLIVYVLYLLFQLKTHAYLYESMPQHIIDEESHPGILNDIFDSSSSSDSSDGSSSSDSDTSGSHTTTKRIKRAFRHRRRRKSNASSTITTSVPSIVSSPSFERTPTGMEQTTMNFHPSRRPSNITTYHPGDDADTERTGRSGQPRIRDFVDGLHEEAIKERSRKKSRKYRKKQHHGTLLDEKVPEESVPAHKKGKKPNNSERTSPLSNVNEDIQMGQLDNSNTSPRRGLAWSESLRPALPKMLTENVFMTAPPNQLSKLPSPRPAPSPGPSRGGGILRRTTSLPDRLNQRAVSPLPRQDAIYPHSHPAVQVSKKEAGDSDEVMSLTSAGVLLLVTTGLVAACAEFLVGAIPGMIEASEISEEFVGLIILPCVSNAAEHFTAVIVATKNKMDLSIGVSLGSSIQISLFVTPFIVILGWIIGQEMTLFFNLFETLAIFVTVFVVNFLVLDGRSNYLEGSLLCAVYTIIAVAAFFYPDTRSQSSIVGGS